MLLLFPLLLLRLLSQWSYGLAARDPRGSAAHAVVAVVTDVAALETEDGWAAEVHGRVREADGDDEQTDALAVVVVVPHLALQHHCLHSGPRSAS